jgi:hypothetical protein
MPRKSDWVPTSRAAEELGCSSEFLLRNRDSLFKVGKHYRIMNPMAYRKTYRWHVIKCQKLMETGGDRSY